MKHRDLQIAANAIRAFNNSTQDVQDVINNAVDMCCDLEATFDEHRRARDTLREALFPGPQSMPLLDAPLHLVIGDDLCVRTKNALRCGGVKTVRQLAAMSVYEFLMLRNIGAKGAIEVRAFLGSHGLDFYTEISLDTRG